MTDKSKTGGQGGGVGERIGLPDRSPSMSPLDSLEFEPDSTYTLLSARRSGKTFFIRNLVRELLERKLIDVVYLFSHTAQYDSGYDWIDRRCILPADRMDDIIKLMWRVQEAKAKKLSAEEKKDKLPHICFILDDWDLEQSNEGLNMLYIRGRHLNFTTIISAQITTRGVSPFIRGNTRYLFIRLLNASNIVKDVYGMILNSDFASSTQFLDFVKANRKDYKFILYDTTEEDPSQTVKVVKAEEVEFQYKLKCKPPTIPPKGDIEGRRLKPPSYASPLTPCHNPKRQKGTIINYMH